MSNESTVTFPPMSVADFCPEGPSDVMPAINPDLSYSTEGYTELPRLKGGIWDNTKSRHAYRHPNGGALCYGFDHDLSDDTYASGTVSGKTTTAKSSIIDSCIEDSIVVDSRVVRSNLNDCIVRDSVLDNVHLTGTVIDNAVIVGPWSLHYRGLARIHRGTWTRPPRFLLIETPNITLGITECTDGCANISSRCHKVEDWLKYGPRLGRMLGWSETEIEMAREFLESLK